ncbi:hypothetical protein CDL12_25970 [Handroanthus impetiginosus]|uniref:CCHC-type domain-containing protein n=1 Tax=Handroanthus impetiginosus TaxID=429701 RepID=A0A2G9G8A7_9LAMI|nr:hypothetical protein CDL12_25970 [Handroanthus impetiginosus]
MTWLLNSLEESVSANIMFLTSAKEMWDALHDMYSQEKNVSRVFELYEKLFSLKQDGSDARLLTDYFASLKGAADEILLYHPLGCDLQTQKLQWNEFLVAKFLSGLNPSLRPVRDSLLASDSVPALSNALSRVLRVATAGSSGPQSPLTTENSAMAGGRGRSSTESKGTRYCTYCGRTNHISEKCWVKFGKPDWANAVTESSQPESDVVTLSRAEYEKLVHCDADHSRVPSVSSSAVASTTVDAFAASHGLVWSNLLHK